MATVEELYAELEAQGVTVLKVSYNGQIYEMTPDAPVSGGGDPKQETMAALAAGRTHFPEFAEVRKQSTVAFGPNVPAEWLRDHVWLLDVNGTVDDNVNLNNRGQEAFLAKKYGSRFLIPWVFVNGENTDERHPTDLTFLYASGNDPDRPSREEIIALYDRQIKNIIYRAN